MEIELIPKSEVEDLYKELRWIVQYHLEDEDVKLYHAIEELFYREYRKLDEKVVKLEFEPETLDLKEYEEWEG